MNAMTVAERQRSSRARRSVEVFSQYYLDGETWLTTERFLEAKEIEFCRKHIVFSEQFDAELLSVFEAILVDNCTEEEGTYSLEDLMWAWRDAEKGVAR